MKPLKETDFCASVELLNQREKELAAMTAQRDQLLEVCKSLLTALDTYPLRLKKPIQDTQAAIASIEKGQGI